MHRTIQTTPARSRQVAICATALGVNGETFIQSAISAAIITLGQNDPLVQLMLARAAGADWTEVEKLVRESIEGQSN
jgi:hypothetical protein